MEMTIYGAEITPSTQDRMLLGVLDVERQLHRQLTSGELDRFILLVCRRLRERQAAARTVH